MANNTLELILKAKDMASQGIKRLSDVVGKSEKDMANQAKRTGQTQEQAAKASARAVLTATQQRQRATATMAAMGMRSEHQIQREIQRTQAAYNRLKASGVASSRELARAAAQTKSQIAALNAEMNVSGKNTGATGAGVMSRGRQMLATGIGAAVGVKNAIAPALNDQKEWEDRVADVALLGFNDKSGDYIVNEGMKRINDAVRATVDKVGGSHDMALSGLNGMMANGMSFEQAEQTLGLAQKMQIAGKASGEDIGSLVKVLTDYGFKGNDLQNALEAALQSGFDGKFEISDMIKTLPGTAVNAQNAGFYGVEGFKYLLSWLQTAANKAGSNDVAANNVNNTLNKINATDTKQRLNKMLVNKKGQKVDYQNILDKGLAKGKNTVEIMVELAEKMLSQDKQYVALQKKLAETKDENLKQTLQAQMDLKKGFVLGNLLPYVQAKAGLNAAADKAQLMQYKNNLNGDSILGNMDKIVYVKGRTAKFQDQKNESLHFLDTQHAAEKTNKTVQNYQEWKNGLDPNLRQVINTVEGTVGMVKDAALYGVGGYVMNAMVSGGAATAGTAGAAGAGAAGATATTAASAGVLGTIGLAATGLLYSSSLNQGEDDFVLQKRQEQELVQKVRNNQASPEEVQQYNAMLDHYAKQREQEKQAKQAEQQAKQRREKLMEQAFTQPFGFGANFLTQGDKAAEQAKPYNGYAKALSTANYPRFSTAFSQLAQSTNYQVDFQQFGESISNGLKAALAGQVRTIQNQIKVDLDGRIIAEQISEYQFNEFKRGL